MFSLEYYYCSAYQTEQKSSVYHVSFVRVRVRNFTIYCRAFISRWLARTFCRCKVEYRILRCKISLLFSIMRCCHLPTTYSISSDLQVAVRRLPSFNTCDIMNGDMFAWILCLPGFILRLYDATASPYVSSFDENVSKNRRSLSAANAFAPR